MYVGDATGRPDPTPVLDGLKDFQRNTVDYVFDRLYGDDDPTRRFLVADEVGLGKTMIARGVIARTIDKLWEDIERIDVVYICSNGDIARQNINRLRLDRDRKFIEPTRLTLLPRTLHNLRKNKLNFVALTPGTSFEPRSSLGTVAERALLYLCLEQEWEMRGAAPRNVLAGHAKRSTFDEWVDWIRRKDDIDRDLADRFRKRLRDTPEGRELRRRWEELLPHFPRAGDLYRRPEDVKQEHREVIALMRRALSETCVDALEPDLIILDEFQRFRELLHVDPETGERSEAGELAELLFRYEDARVLLLSATPYTLYSRAEDQDADHYRDFIATIRFLTDSDLETERIGAMFAELRRELLNWRGEEPERLLQIKCEIEGMLRQVMCRTERLAFTRNGDGMLREVPPQSLKLESTDLDAYIATAKVAEALGEPDQLEPWKSSPYLLNMMDGYKLKQRLEGAIEDGESGPEGRAVTKALRAARRSLLSGDDIRAFKRIDPQNARLRSLAADTLDRGVWKLLWLPPSLPYYRPGGPFANPELRDFTKRLIFSAWNVVPKAIATLMSYEAERRMVRLEGRSTENTTEARASRRGLLRFTLSDDRHHGLQVVALLYPSFALADRVNLVTLAAENGGVAMDREGLLRHVSDQLRPELDRLVTSHSRFGGPDARWYLAAPLLLDATADRERTLAWLEDERVVAEWPGIEKDRMQSQTGWREHIEEAIAIVREPGRLGRPPGDLLEVTARLAVAGPGTAALRALTRASGDDRAFLDPEVRIAAGAIGWAFRSLFNSPEVTALIRGLGGPSPTYWRQVLDYCVDGCVQAALDEYAHLVRESQGLVGDRPAGEIALELAEVMSEAIAVRTSQAGIDEIGFSDGRPEIRDARMRMHFAMRFGDQTSDDGDRLHRAEVVRHAFNSPFWPFILASTSVGQEGLDFHQYCHAVVHWNLPANPVDMEQREGRVHRYKGHAVRRNLAAAHGREALASGANDVWQEVFNAAVRARPADANDLHPYWLAEGEARIERHVPALPLSRDERRLQSLRHSLALYRMAFGQARQDDLIEYLATRIPAEDLERHLEALQIDLSPSGEQMTAEVLAIEVKQYVGREDGLRTLVPRMVGQTAAAETRKASRERRRWDETSLLTEIEETKGEAELRAAQELLDWARGRPGMRFWWSSGAMSGSCFPYFKHAGYKHWPFSLRSDGQIKIGFDGHAKHPPFDDEELRRELLRRINHVPGLDIPADAINRVPSFRLSVLAESPEALDTFKSALDWYCEMVLSYPGG